MIIIYEITTRFRTYCPKINNIEGTEIAMNILIKQPMYHIFYLSTQDFISKKEYFLIEDFEKDYILNNSLFRQRSSIKKVALPTEYFLIVH